MKRFLMIVPPNIKDEDIESQGKPNLCRKEYFHIRYGVLSIVSYAKEKLGNEVEVKILNLDTEKYFTLTQTEIEEVITQAILSFQPNVIGISAMYSFLFRETLLVAKTCRKACNDAIIFAGGPCAMAYAKELLKTGDADAVSFFEGEKPICRLLNTNKPFDELNNGVSWQTAQKAFDGYVPQSESIENLDDIPRMDFDLLDDITKYSEANPIISHGVGNIASLPIHTSRGCPFNCVFCASHFVHGKSHRKSSAQRVISDVKYMVEKYKITMLEICDDQFLLDNARAKEILRGLIPLNLEIVASSGLSIFALDDELAYLLAKAGMRSVILALESGSQHVLDDIIHKPVNLEKSLHVIQLLKSNNIETQITIVMGFPGENKNDWAESERFLLELPIDWMSVYCALPLRGSRLYDICTENNLFVDADVPKNGFFKSIITTDDFTADEVSEEAYRLNLNINFINNYNLRTGNYKVAYDYFKYLTGRYPHHAIAFYALSKAEEKLNMYKESEQAYIKYKAILSEDESWRHYACKLGLEQ